MTDGGMAVFSRNYPTHNVIPAQAGIHAEGQAHRNCR